MLWAHNRGSALILDHVRIPEEAHMSTTRLTRLISATWSVLFAALVIFLIAGMPVAQSADTRLSGDWDYYVMLGAAPNGGFEARRLGSALSRAEPDRSCMARETNRPNRLGAGLRALAGRRFAACVPGHRRSSRPDDCPRRYRADELCRQAGRRWSIRGGARTHTVSAHR